MTNRMPLAEVLDALDGITPETMALAQASLRRAAERIAAEHPTQGLRAALADTLAVGPDVSDDDLIACVRDVLTRAETAEATVRDYENRLTWETNCGEHARLLDSCRAADERAEKAEKRATGWEQRCIAADRARAGALTRARTAEVTLTAVREAVALAVLHEDPFRLACPQCATDHLATIEAALGDPQPATKPEASAAACGPEAQWDTTAPEPEQPAEPQLISVIDALAADLINAFRRAITTITKD